jgi:hypothetical protein
MRDRRAEVAADRLREGVRNLGPAPAAPRRPLVSGRTGLFGGLVLLAALGAIGYLLYQRNFFGMPFGEGTEGGASSSVPAGPALDPAVRAEKVCEASRQSIYAGASLGVDTAGWVVELWLARPEARGRLAADPGLAKAVEPGPLAAKLGAAAPATTKLVDDPAPALGASAVLVRLDGGFVAAFLETAGRQRFIDWTDEVLDAVGAEHAALYARCEHLPVRDVGAYFVGRDPAGAAATLLYAEGAFIQPPAIKRPPSVGPTGWLGELRKAGDELDQAALEQLARKAGARLATRAPDAGVGAVVGLRFPLSGPTRAHSASRELARTLGL